MTNTKRIILFFGLFIFGLFFLNSCREIYDKKYISQGTIEYQVKYINSESNPLVSLFPEKMFCHFKNNKIALDLSGGMGLFRTTFIFDNEKKTFLQLVKIMNNKYASTLNLDSIGYLINEFPKLRINVSNETKEIAGYKCNKAEVIFDNPIYPNFDIYFTKDINIKNPNWCSPFNQIDGVLMEYRMKKYNMEMEISAINVSKEEIKNEIFESSKEYKTISIKDLDTMLEELN